MRRERSRRRARPRLVQPSPESLRSRPRRLRPASQLAARGNPPRLRPHPRSGRHLKASTAPFKQPQPQEILATRTGKLRSRRMIFPPKSPNAAISRPTPEVFPPKHRPPTHRNTANAPLSPRNPLFPTLWSGPTAGSVAARQKQFPRSLSDFEPAPQFDSLNSWPRALFP